MKTIKLQLLGLQLFASPNVRGNVAAAIVKPTKEYPYGVMEISQGNLARISARCIKVNHPQGLSLLVDASNGSATLSVNMEERKAGDSYEKRDGSKGTIQKDHIAWNNHEITLGIAAQLKVTEIALGQAYASAGSFAPAKTVVVDEPKTEAPKV